MPSHLGVEPRTFGLEVQRAIHCANGTTNGGDPAVLLLTIEFSPNCTCFGSTYTKIGTIQRRLAWPLRKDDTQNREAFHIFAPALSQTFSGNTAERKNSRPSRGSNPGPLG